jgi:hypothetical protein
MSNSASSSNTTGSGVGQSNVEAYVALSRESRKSVAQSEFMAILRFWFGTVMIDKYYKGSKTEEKLAEQRARYDALSLDDVFNRSLGMVGLEIGDLLRHRVANLTPFVTLVVERVLDREHPSEFRPLDIPTLRGFKPPTMLNGTEYSHEECCRIHADMSVEQIQDDIAQTCAALIKTFNIQSLQPGMVAELTANCTREVKDKFRVEDALKRYERTRG